MSNRCAVGGIDEKRNSLSYRLPDRIIIGNKTGIINADSKISFTDDLNRLSNIPFGFSSNLIDDQTEHEGLHFVF